MGNRLLSRALAIGLIGVLAAAASGGVAAASPAGGAAAAAKLTSRPVVWVSGQDTGQVFVTKGTTVLKTFDFVQGTPAGTPVIPGAGTSATPPLSVPSPKPHLITFSPDARFAYVTFQNTNPGTVAVIDTTNLTVKQLITIPTTVPTSQSPRVTQAKSSPDGTFLFVTSIGVAGTPTGTLTKVLTDEPTNPANPTWTVGPQATDLPGGGLTLNSGPACTSFSPSGARAYVDSSLQPPVLGVMDLDPVTMTVSAFHPTAGDPQCGIHDPIVLNGVPTIVVTDNGASGSNQGHVHIIDTTIPNNFTEVPPSPIPAANLHDNWPVGLEPAGAPTSDPANTAYGSDRDLSTLHRMLLETTTDQVLPIVDPNVPATPAGFNSTTFQPRDAPDTLDGSGNTVFVAMKEFGDLGIIDNFNKQTYLHLVNPDPSCGEVGNSNFHKCFTVHAVTVQPVARHGSITVPAGILEVLRDTTINGSIQVQPGGQLVLERSNAEGPVTSVGAQSIRICDTTTDLTAPVTIGQSQGFVLVGGGGDAGDDGCLSNVLGGGLTLLDNKHGVEAIDNTALFVLSRGNAGSGPFLPEDTTPDISGNHQ